VAGAAVAGAAVAGAAVAGAGEMSSQAAAAGCYNPSLPATPIHIQSPHSNPHSTHHSHSHSLLTNAHTGPQWLEAGVILPAPQPRAPRLAKRPLHFGSYLRALGTATAPPPSHSPAANGPGGGGKWPSLAIGLCHCLCLCLCLCLCRACLSLLAERQPFALHLPKAKPSACAHGMAHWPHSLQRRWV
jgi:hypothetical protein